MVFLLHFLSRCLHGPCLLGLAESDTCAGYSSRAHQASRDPWICHHDHHGPCVHFIPALRDVDQALQWSKAQLISCLSRVITQNAEAMKTPSRFLEGLRVKAAGSHLFLGKALKPIGIHVESTGPTDELPRFRPLAFGFRELGPRKNVLS